MNWVVSSVKNKDNIIVKSNHTFMNRFDDLLNFGAKFIKTSLLTKKS